MIDIIKKIRVNFSFIALAIILAAAFFIFFLGNFKYYQSEIKILFIPKSEKTAVQTSYILENLVRLPGMLSFYEKMVRENKDITDQFSGKPKDERKKMWNEMIDVQKDDGSSIIILKITSRDKNQSPLLAKRAVQTLFGTASFYYDIKTDIDLRIADEVITKTILKNWIWLLAGSVIFGLALSYFLNSLFNKITYFFPAKSPDLKKKEELFFKKTERIKKPEEVREIPRTWLKTAGAPENLPIGEALTAEEIPEKPEIAESREEIIFSEPTEEEMKKRLNQLLRGEL